MLCFLIALVPALFCLVSLEARLHPQRSHQRSHYEKEPSPWLTGPLLTSSAHTVPAGHYNIEPFQFVTSNFGRYDAHWNARNRKNNFYNLITQVPIQYGLAKRWDITLVPQWAWNHTNGASQWVILDPAVGFSYQIYDDKRSGWFPSVMLNVSANVPIGRYEKLKARLKGTDIGGTGSWRPSVGISLSKLIHIKDRMFFAPRWAIDYTIPNPVYVKGLNAYGGGKGTRGKAFPAQLLTAQFGFEVSLTQNWAIATDVQYLHFNKIRFKGRKGKTNGVTNTVGRPSRESFSLAPAFEYNWSPFYGLIAGAWFSIAGRNSTQFISGVVAVNIYH